MQRNLSRDDIGNQGRYLLGQFIHDRLRADGYLDAPELDHLIEPGTPTGTSMGLQYYSYMDIFCLIFHQL